MQGSEKYFFRRIFAGKSGREGLADHAGQWVETKKQRLTITMKSSYRRSLLQKSKIPFDPSASSGLRANGCRIEIIDFLSFVVSLSNHPYDICKSLHSINIKILYFCGNNIPVLRLRGFS